MRRHFFLLRLLGDRQAATGNLERLIEAPGGGQCRSERVQHRCRPKLGCFVSLARVLDRHGRMAQATVVRCGQQPGQVVLHDQVVRLDLQRPVQETSRCEIFVGGAHGIRGEQQQQSVIVVRFEQAPGCRVIRDPLLDVVLLKHAKGDRYQPGCRLGLKPLPGEPYRRRFQQWLAGHNLGRVSDHTVHRYLAMVQSNQLAGAVQQEARG